MPALPEFKLLIDCCRASFARAAPALIMAPDARLDWPRFVRLARFHRVQGIAYDVLASSGYALPGSAARALSDDASAIAANNLRAATEARALLKEFRQAGLPLMFLKGLTTGALAYRSAMLKMNSDIDILTGPEFISRAAALLRNREFELVVPGTDTNLDAWHRKRKESLWRRGDGLQVDLHSRLSDNPALIPGLNVESPSQEVEVVPDIRLPTLAEDELIAYLCVHGASSAWFRLKWISDLAGILQPCNDLQLVAARCQNLGAGRAGNQALLLMAHVFNPERRADLRRQLDPDRPTQRLVENAFRQLAVDREPRAPTATFLGTARIHLTQLLLVPGLKFKVGEAWRQAGDAIAHLRERRRIRKI